MAKSRSPGRQKKPSLGEELRAASVAADLRKQEAEAASARAAKEAHAKREAELPAEALSYFTGTLLPRLRAAAEKGEGLYSEELSKDDAFVNALLKVLTENQLEASANLEDCEDPNTEIPTKYKAYVITIRIR